MASSSVPAAAQAPARAQCHSYGYEDVKFLKFMIKHEGEEGISNDMSKGWQLAQSDNSLAKKYLPCCSYWEQAMFFFVAFKSGHMANLKICVELSGGRDLQFAFLGALNNPIFTRSSPDRSKFAVALLGTALSEFKPCDADQACFERFKSAKIESDIFDGLVLFAVNPWRRPHMRDYALFHVIMVILIGGRVACAAFNWRNLHVLGSGLLFFVPVITEILYYWRPDPFILGLTTATKAGYDTLAFNGLKEAGSIIWIWGPLAVFSNLLPALFAVLVSANFSGYHRVWKARCLPRLVSGAERKSPFICRDVFLSTNAPVAIAEPPRAPDAVRNSAITTGIQADPTDVVINLEDDII